MLNRNDRFLLRYIVEIATEDEMKRVAGLLAEIVEKKTTACLLTDSQIKKAPVRLGGRSGALVFPRDFGTLRVLLSLQDFTGKYESFRFRGGGDAREIYRQAIK
jgi:hypothetical protein